MELDRDKWNVWYYHLVVFIFSLQSYHFNSSYVYSSMLLVFLHYVYCTRNHFLTFGKMLLYSTLHPDRFILGHKLQRGGNRKQKAVWSGFFTHAVNYSAVVCFERKLTLPFSSFLNMKLNTEVVKVDYNHQLSGCVSRSWFGKYYTEFNFLLLSTLHAGLRVWDCDYNMSFIVSVYWNQIIYWS